jgi:hypothetical protein
MITMTAFITGNDNSDESLESKASDIGVLLAKEVFCIMVSPVQSRLWKGQDKLFRHGAAV